MNEVLVAFGLGWMAHWTLIHVVIGGLEVLAQRIAKRDGARNGA